MNRALAMAGVLIALLALAGWSRFQWDADVLNTLPPQEPSVHGLQWHQQYFASADELIIRVRTDTEDETTRIARALAEHLRQHTSLVASAWWQPPLEGDPSALAALVAEAWLHAPPPEVERLREALTPAAVSNTLANVRERLATSLTPAELGRLSYDPLGLTRILDASTPLFSEEAAGANGFQSSDGRCRFVWVKARPHLSGYRECRAWLDQLRLLIRHWQDSNGLPASLEIGYTGRPAFMAEIGGGMERDLSGPALGTLALIAALFYAVHRRWRPLLWLLALLVLNFALTLGLGVWVLGNINVVNLGFAAILLGLAADYAIVLLQEARAHPDLSRDEIQRRARPAIYWSAATTAGAFLLLNFSGLPGLGQLGTLVALGIVLAAVMMTHLYLWPLRTPEIPVSTAPTGAPHARLPAAPALRWRLWVSVGLGGACAVLLGLLGWPTFQRATEALRPKHSEAYAVWDEFKQATSTGREPLLLLVRSPSAQGLYAAASDLRRQGESLAAQGIIHSLDLPLELALEALLEAAIQPGFTTNAMQLTLRVLDHWAKAGGSTTLALPEAARWLRDRCYVHRDGQHVLLGVIRPAEAASPDALHLRSPAAAPVEIHVTNWEWMGSRLAQMVQRELPWLVGAMGGMVLLALWLAFRAWREVLLSVGALAFSVLLLLAWMRVVGWEWNLMNLMALPLMLGLGVDYCLHLLLGLRRHQGDWAANQRAVGRALLLAGATTAAAFASLHFSSNAGVASLGQVTAAGVTLCLLTSLLFLPAWERSSSPPE
jgi:predicted exporter